MFFCFFEFICFLHFLLALGGTPNETLLLPGQDEPLAAKAAAGHRFWETKVAKGTVPEPRGAGVADARGRRAASPPGGWVVKAKMKWCFVCAKQSLCFNFRRFFPLASVSAGRPSVSARRPRSGVVARAAR